MREYHESDWLRERAILPQFHHDRCRVRGWQRMCVAINAGGMHSRTILPGLVDNCGRVHGGQRVRDCIEPGAVSAGFILSRRHHCGVAVPTRVLSL